ncbi:MAG TPA: TetR/AcrR family transcriptional regulator [Hyphomonas sp.]|nr:TetR/AcrR family transcriptional regulator [Hyphomonas sp.]HRJ01936.1 TetR/AcrR family transcriptional regulator [Hyphomonas sp.]
MTIQIVSKGEQTRLRLMDIAQASVLEKGFSATSIEEIITEAGITKSGFFYHFKDKNDLAKALVERYIHDEVSLLDEVFAQADSLSEDPLHSFLIFLKLLAERLADLPNGHPGCIVASCCYQEQLFSQDVRDLCAGGHLTWRRVMRGRLDRIAAKYPPKVDVDFEALADMFSALADGGIILSRSLKDPSKLAQQLLLYRGFVRTVFEGT